MGGAGSTVFTFVNSTTSGSSTTESSFTSLNSHVACTARNLSVSVTVAPGGVATQTFKVRANGADVISCTITGAATTCNSGATSGLIAADATIDMSLTQP